MHSTAPTVSAVAARTFFDKIKQENKKGKKQIMLHETVYSPYAAQL
ncbi:MAG: hypothetical protein MI749_17785 [Desulfovibrionales bacterium]|nr:hypothetical protein [Desulfovibrionales bacterium]